MSGQKNKLNVNHLTNFSIFFRLSSKKNSLAGQSEMSSDGSNSSRKENVPPELMICIDMNTGKFFNYFDGYFLTFHACLNPNYFSLFELECIYRSKKSLEIS